MCRRSPHFKTYIQASCVFLVICFSFSAYAHSDHNLKSAREQSQAPHQTPLPPSPDCECILHGTCNPNESPVSVLGSLGLQNEIIAQFVSRAPWKSDSQYLACLGDKSSFLLAKETEKGARFYMSAEALDKLSGDLRTFANADLIRVRISFHKTGGYTLTNTTIQPFDCLFPSENKEGPPLKKYLKDPESLETRMVLLPIPRWEADPGGKSWQFHMATIVSASVFDENRFGSAAADNSGDELTLEMRAISLVNMVKRSNLLRRIRKITANKELIDNDDLDNIRYSIRNDTLDNGSLTPGFPDFESSTADFWKVVSERALLKQLDDELPTTFLEKLGPASTLKGFSNRNDAQEIDEAELIKQLTTDFKDTNDAHLLIRRFAQVVDEQKAADLPRPNWPIQDSKGKGGITYNNSKLINNTKYVIELAYRCKTGWTLYKFAFVHKT